MFGRKKKVEVRYVDRIVYRDAKTSEDAKLRIRVEAFIKKAESEYARLSHEVSENRKAAEAGGYLDNRETEVRAARQLGQMTVITQALTLIKGTDSLVEGFQQEKKADARRNEVFPMTSFLASQHPLYAEKR